MTIIIESPQKAFTLHPEGGPFPAVVSEVTLHENVQTQYGPKDRLRIVFQTNQLARDFVDDVIDERPMTVTLFTNSTLNVRSRLRELVGQQVSNDRLAAILSDSKGIDIKSLLIGTQWLLTVKHEEANGRTYANIKSTMKAPEGQHMTPWTSDF